MAAMTGIFKEAVDRSRELQKWVMDRQTDAIDQANKMREAALQGIDEMSDFTPSLSTGLTPPTPPELTARIDADFDLPELSQSSFGQVTPINRGDFGVSGIGPVDQIEIEAFVPGFETIQVPDAPELRDFGPVPGKPTLDAIVLPSKPELEKPLMPSMVNITIPEFIFPVMPVFNAQAPEWIDTPISTVLQWSETPYEVEILDEVLAKLRLMWEGGTGLPPAVEQALWERAASREDMAIARDVSAAAIEFSSRGFSLPPGVLVNRLDAIRADGALRKQALGRDILIKVADTQIENLRFACTQAMAAEQVLESIWAAAAQREFEAAKIQLDSQLALLNSRIAIFNAKQSAYATEATVFRAKLEAALATIQVFRAQVDAEIAKGQVNEQRVRVYSEQIKALLADLEIYKTEMSGAELQSTIQRNQIEAYKVEVQAYAEVLQADKVRFDVYESQVKGETAKAGLIESRARAYSAYVSGQSARAEIGIKNQQAEIAMSDQRLRAHIANLDKDKTLIQAQSAAIAASAEAHRANTTRFVAVAGAESSKIELQVKVAEAGMRNSLALYEVEIKRYISDMEQMIRAASLQLEALKAAGQATATMAAGAMAGTSIGASVSASAGISASGSENTSIAL